ncbi:AroM family protein [Candidatus Puniceispirillum sp.]|nr:AroM family protein [Candidatus Puniceispirillum sp.]
MKHDSQSSILTDSLQQNVGLVSLGQTPRHDLAREIRHFVGCPMNVLEFGLLDGLSAADLSKIKDSHETSELTSQQKVGINGPADEPLLMTELRDGSKINLSLDYASERMVFLYNELALQPIDLVVLMTTIICPTPAPARATIFCDKIVDRAIETFAGSGLKVGVIISLESQRQLLRYANVPNAKASAKTDFEPSIFIAAAPPGDDVEMRVALNTLKGCDVFVLHSISYCESKRKQIAEYLDKPVIHARRLIATAIREALERLTKPTGSQSNAGHGLVGNEANISAAMISRLRTLSNREREIMFKVSSGLTNKEIAFHLGISFRTVEIHRARMMTKMSFQNVAELIRAVDSLLEY